MAANSSGGPNTAVVLLTHNRKELLRSVLSDLLEWTDIGAIIVINNASTDGSSGMIEHDFPSVVHVETTENLEQPAGAILA